MNAYFSCLYLFVTIYYFQRQTISLGLIRIAQTLIKFASEQKKAFRLNMGKSMLLVSLLLTVIMLCIWPMSRLLFNQNVILNIVLSYCENSRNEQLFNIARIFYIGRLTCI